MALLQRTSGGSEVLSKVVLDSILEEASRQVEVTLDTPPGPLPLCHKAIVARTCQKMNEGDESADSVTTERIQEMLAINDSAVALLWRSLNLTAQGETVTCEALCSSIVEYISSVGILPPSSDRACVTADGKTKCEVDVSPQKLVRDMATAEDFRPDDGVMEDKGGEDEEDEEEGEEEAVAVAEVEAEEIPAGLVQYAIEMAPGGPRLVRRGSVGAGSAAPAQLLQAEAEGEERAEPTFCPLTLWETVEVLANYFRIFPSKGVSPRVFGPEPPSLAQGGGQVKTASGASVSQIIAQNNAQAKAWASTVSLELARGNAAASRRTWFGSSGSKTESQVKSRLVQAMSFIEKELDTMYYVYPADQASNTACTGNTAAYVWKSSSSAQGYEETRGPTCTTGNPMSQRCGVLNGKYYVYLCQRWTQDPATARTATLIHEAAHHTGPGDITYDRETAKRMQQSQQLDNAANYQHFSQEVANAAYGCVDNNPPNVAFSCNPGPCTCPPLARYCQDQTYGATVRSQCAATCGACDMSGGPAPAPNPPPPPPPPPPPAGGCRDRETGKFNARIGGTTYSSSCSGFAGAGYCTNDEVRNNCQSTCGACSASPAPAPAPNPPPPPPPPPAGGCRDRETGKFTARIGGTTYSSSCSGFAGAGYCTNDEVRNNCQSTCGACSASPGCVDDGSYSIQTPIGPLACNDWKRYQCWEEVKPYCPVSCRVPGCVR